MNVKINGMNKKIFACTGSAGVGFSRCCRNIVSPMIIGHKPMLTIDRASGTSQGIRPKPLRMVSGSGAERSSIQP